MQNQRSLTILVQVGEGLVVYPQLELVPVLHHAQGVPPDREGEIEGSLVAEGNKPRLILTSYCGK